MALNLARIFEDKSEVRGGDQVWEKGFNFVEIWNV